jgi:hypothetical protein
VNSAGDLSLQKNIKKFWLEWKINWIYPEPNLISTAKCAVKIQPLHRKSFFASKIFDFQLVCFP